MVLRFIFKFDMACNNQSDPEGSLQKMQSSVYKIYIYMQNFTRYFDILK